MFDLYQKIIKQLKQKAKVTPQDIAIYLRQFATLINAGISVIECLTILGKSQQKANLKIMTQSIKNELLTGKTLQEAMKKLLFSNELINQIIYIGEQTGKLDELLPTLANHLEQAIALKRKIKQILFYPTLLLLCSFCVSIFLLLVIVPHFAALFKEIDKPLPMISKLIFFISEQLNQNKLILLLIILFIGIFLKIKSKQFIFHFINLLPFSKQLQLKINMVRFSRNLAISYAAGISLTKSLSIVLTTISDFHFRQMLTRINRKLEFGLPFNQAIDHFQEFPFLIKQFIKIGEESGKLDAMLFKVANLLEAEIDDFLTQMTQILEPLIMLVLGVLIGGLVIGMYLPIFQLGSVI